MRNTAGTSLEGTVTDERFWSKVCRGPRPDDCWLWVGAVSDDGYGRFWTQRDGQQISVRPQRFAHQLLTGEALPSHVVLMHLCDVPLCVRATGEADSHLAPGSQADNLLDRSQKLRHANAYTWRWRGIGRANLAAQSRQLRGALKENGWDEEIIRPLMSGYDPDAPTLF